MQKCPGTSASSFVVLTAAVLLCSTACASLTKKVARDATPEAIDSGIQAGLSEQNQEAVVDAIEPARVEQATDKVAAGATDGWAKAMGEGQRQARVAEALAPVVASLVDASVERALSDEHLARVRELAKQATLGFQDAIDEVTQQRDKGEIPRDEGNVLEAVDKLAEDGWTTLSLVGAFAGVLGLLLVVGLAWAFSRRRRYEKEIADRNRALEAAVRMLSRKGMRLEDAPGDGPNNDELSEADAEFLRSAVRRLGRDQPSQESRSGLV